MNPSLVTREHAGDVAILRLNRPPANAINLVLAEAMVQQFEATVADRPAAIVATGTAAFFSGGLDLKDVPAYAPAEQRDLLHTLNGMVARLYAAPMPVVGAINGHAIAGGLILALLPDYRVGPEGPFQFGLTEARVGIPFPAAPMIVLQAELAPADVRYLTLHARNVPPAEALRRGVFDELQPPDRVLDRAVEVATDLARAPADAYATIKRQVRAGPLAQLEALRSGAVSDPMLEAWLSADAPEAASAMLGGSTQAQA